MELLSTPRSCSRFGREVYNSLVSSFKHDRAVVKEELRWVSSISSVPNSSSSWKLRTLKPSVVLQQADLSVESILRPLTTLRTRVTRRRCEGISDHYFTGRVTYEKLSPVFSAKSKKNPGSNLSLGKDDCGL